MFELFYDMRLCYKYTHKMKGSTKMRTEQIQEVRDTFQSILRADYISISDVKQLKNLNDYYVDFFNLLPKVLQNQDSFINGRRGTGKTTLLMRAYYECMKTISPIIKEESNILHTKKVLPIYIDLSQCKEMFSQDNENLEHSFIVKIVEEIRNQLDTMFQESKFKLGKQDFSKLEEFERLSETIREGILLKVAKKNILQESNSCTTESIEGSISLKGADVKGDKRVVDEDSTSYALDEVRGYNVQQFLGCLGKIRQRSGLDAIYILVDEFSDLSDSEQEKFSILLKKLLGSKNNVFFKVGTITDRFYFGKDIIIGRDIYPIYLDLSDFVERYGGIVAAGKELVNYTEELIKKRLDSFAFEMTLNDIFKGNKGEILLRISREAMGVPRTIGLILQNALTQAEVKNEKFIQLSDINVGIRETRKIYFKQFQGAVQKKAIPGFYMDMWNSLLKRALDEKGKNPNRPASHFMIDPIRKKYLNTFCENFMVHCLEDSRASKYGGNYVLYALDYDICNDNSIMYAEEKDEFTAIRFIYDSVFQAYDCYFLKEKIKSYKCPLCNKIYEEKDVAQAKVKRCFECDEKLEEIIHKDVPISDGNYTEVEVKILGIIATLNKEEAMSATEIGDAVGCSYQKVANWCSKVLAKKDLIDVEKRDGRNYYYDKIKKN